MKFLGYLFLVLVLIATGIVIVKTGLWELFINWLQGIVLIR